MNMLINLGVIGLVMKLGKLNMIVLLKIYLPHHSILMNFSGSHSVHQPKCWKLFWLKYKRGGELDFKTF